MEPYCYRRLQRLENGSRQIRLLTLFRGSFDDEIRVSMDVHSLRLTNSSCNNEEQIEQIDFKWFALSYTWGDSENRCKISVQCPNRSGNATDVAVNQGYLSVTKNLEEALRYLRYDHADRIMWVDAVCIDQGDDDDALRERAWQVQIMHFIYGNATGVIIWLGLEANDSTFALHSLQSLGSSFQAYRNNWDSPLRDDKEDEWADDWSDLHRHGRERQALGQLLERPWFGRVWIRQEAYFANESESLVICGTSFVPFTVFRDAIFGANVFGLVNRDGNMRSDTVNAIFQRSAIDAVTLSLSLRNSSCKDPRDKIYGILGILAGSQGRGKGILIRVDYSVSNSAEQVYKIYFLQYTLRQNSLMMLSEAGLWQGSKMRPSWIPDWRIPILDRRINTSVQSAASCFGKAECRYLKHGILGVFGCRADQIAQVHIFGLANAGPTDSDFWKGLAMFMLTKLDSLEARTATKRLAYALLCCMVSFFPPDDRSRLVREEIELREEIEEYLVYLQSETQTLGRDNALRPKLPRDVISDDAATMLEQSVTSLIRKNRIVFSLTVNHHIGVGIMNMEPGDQIWAILGSRALITLREVTKNRYKVVGPCHMHGFNWGEAVLGPLPDNYIVVEHIEQVSNGRITKPYYVDTKTGSTSMWDPRIAWEELAAHPPMDNFRSFAVSPGEPVRRMPDSDYLRRHGIKIQEIDLV